MRNELNSASEEKDTATGASVPGEVRVRIAPSPTGDPHVGTAYVALFNYAFAKRRQGKFILRIEDTDRARSTSASEAAILRGLRWLGLTWDEGPDVGGPHGPYRQSERGKIYESHAKILVESGEAYRCFCTAERLADMRDRQRAAKRPSGYDGKCRDLPADEVSRFLDEGLPYTIRLKMPRSGESVITDEIRGEIKTPNARSDDQILLKSDGMPTYHLANVVDDHLMGITHVIRAEEWIPSAPKHIRLYHAFGWTPPRWIHLPLLRNNDKNKSKISKRRNPVSLDYYRDIGILPQAMINFLALMGWSFGDDREKFSLSEICDRIEFSRGSLSLSGPAFDLEKLSWLNGHYLRELSDESFVDTLMAWRLNRHYLLSIAPLVRERIRRFDEFVPLTTYFFSGDLDYHDLVQLIIPKSRKANECANMLNILADRLDVLDRWNAESLESLFRDFCEAEGWTTRELFMSVRIVVTGRKASPPLFETMVAIGRELCRRRIRQAVLFLRATKSS